MKKFQVFVAVATIAMATISAAQTPSSIGGAPVAAPAAGQAKPHPFLDALKQMNLTPDQSTRIKALIDQHKVEAKAIRRHFKGLTDVVTEKARLKDLQKQYREKIAGLLRPEQKLRLQQLVKAERAKLKAGGQIRPQR